MLNLQFEEILGVVWDFDGVLIPESERVNIAAAVKTFADLGFHLTPEEIASIKGRSSRMFVPNLLRARGVGSSQYDGVIALNRTNYDVIWPGGATIAPWLADVLIHLIKINSSLAIATTNRRSVVDRFLEHMLPIQNPFRVIVTGENVRKHKPDPEIYQIAAARLNIQPDKLLAVEDTSIGIEAAKAAGLRCAAISNSFNKKQDFSGADYRLKSLHELLTVKGGK